VFTASHFIAASSTVGKMFIGSCLAALLYAADYGRGYVSTTSNN
jgi:hypothetical protein